MEDSKKKYQDYAAELKALPGVSATERKDKSGIAWTFTSTQPCALEVELRWWQKGADFIALYVEGVDCGYWHTAELETLDYYIELAKAALRGDVATNRSPIFKFKEACFKVGDSWECTLTDNAGAYHYIKTRKRLNNREKY